MVEKVSRGYVYAYNDGKSDKERCVLCLSAGHRGYDKFASTLMLGDSPLGHDVVKIRNNMFEEGIKYVHCGMVTYTPKDSLVKELFRVPDETMVLIDASISRELAINDDSVAKAKFYEHAYNELLDKVMSKEEIK